MMRNYMTIELKGLRFFSGHGLYPGEAEAGNEFEVDVLLQYETPEKPITSIDETVNYAAVFKIVQSEFSIRQDLLETCAMKITDELYKTFPVLVKQVVSIKKLMPLLTNFTGLLGVTYTRLHK
jgi:dihydroneopterin aldolase